MLRFYIPNMTCGSCAKSVTKALLSVDPQARIETVPSAREVRVDSALDESAFLVALSEAGYVHAHAMAADSPKGGHASHGSHDDPKAAIPAKLMLHVTLPRAGRHALWIQFKGDGQVRTVPFVVTAPAAP
jgi:copper chaperone CopZ